MSVQARGVTVAVLRGRGRFDSIARPAHTGG